MLFVLTLHILILVTGTWAADCTVGEFKDKSMQCGSSISDAARNFSLDNATACSNTIVTSVDCVEGIFDDCSDNVFVQDFTRLINVDKAREVGAYICTHPNDIQAVGSCAATETKTNCLISAGISEGLKIISQLPHLNLESVICGAWNMTHFCLVDGPSTCFADPDFRNKVVSVFAECPVPPTDIELIPACTISSFERYFNTCTTEYGDKLEGLFNLPTGQCISTINGFVNCFLDEIEPCQTFPYLRYLLQQSQNALAYVCGNNQEFNKIIQCFTPDNTTDSTPANGNDELAGLPQVLQCTIQKLYAYTINTTNILELGCIGMGYMIDCLEVDPTSCLTPDLLALLKDFQRSCINDVNNYQPPAAVTATTVTPTPGTDVSDCTVGEFKDKSIQCAGVITDAAMNFTLENENSCSATIMASIDCADGIFGDCSDNVFIKDFTRLINVDKAREVGAYICAHPSDIQAVGSCAATETKTSCLINASISEGLKIISQLPDLNLESVICGAWNITNYCLVGGPATCFADPDFRNKVVSVFAECPAPPTDIELKPACTISSFERYFNTCMTEYGDKFEGLFDLPTGQCISTINGFVYCFLDEFEPCQTFPYFRHLLQQSQNALRYVCGNNQEFDKIIKCFTDNTTDSTPANGGDELAGLPQVLQCTIRKMYAYTIDTTNILELVCIGMGYLIDCLEADTQSCMTPDLLAILKTFQRSCINDVATPAAVTTAAPADTTLEDTSTGTLPTMSLFVVLSVLLFWVGF